MKFDSDDPEYYGLVIQPIRAKLPDHNRDRRVRQKRKKEKKLREKRRKLLDGN